MASALITDLLGALDELAGGVHPGFRPAHANLPLGGTPPGWVLQTKAERA